VSEVQLKAEPRNEFGKGAARRLRRANKVPAVLYGHGGEPVHVALDAHATMLALKHTNALLSVNLDGKSQLALPKDIQRDALRGTIEHVDLLVVRRGEKVHVEVRVQVRGTSFSGTVVSVELSNLTLEAEATSIPALVEVDVEGAQAGLQIHARDIVLPAGSTLVTDADALVVHVSAAAAAEADAAAEETATA